MSGQQILKVSVMKKDAEFFIRQHVRVLLYINPVHWAAVCGACRADAAGMCRGRYMHKVEVHGAAMYNE